MAQDQKLDLKNGRFRFNITFLLCFIIIILIGFFGVISPSFFTYKNLSRMLTNQAIIGILAITLTPLIISRGLDLSFGHCVSLSTVIMAMLHKNGNINLIFIIILGFLIPVILGLINGLLTEYFGLNPLILTLGMGAIYLALAMVLSEGSRSISMLTDSLYNFARNTILGIPYPVVVLIGVIAIAWVLLSYSKLGQKIYFLGANPVAAKLSGIKVKQIKIFLYLFMGMGTGIAAIIMLASSGTGFAYHGANIPLPVLSAVFLGGMTLSGGRGNIFNTLLGVVVIAILFNGFSLLNFQFYFIRIIQGCALILIVAIFQVRNTLVSHNPKKKAV